MSRRPKNPLLILLFISAFPLIDWKLYMEGICLPEVNRIATAVYTDALCFCDMTR